MVLKCLKVFKRWHAGCVLAVLRHRKKRKRKKNEEKLLVGCSLRFKRTNECKLLYEFEKKKT